MKVRNSDTVYSNGRLYRLDAWGLKERSSTDKPTHDKGNKIYNDGLKWIMVQENDVVMNCGVRNVHFKNIFLEKKSDYAFSFHFDNDEYSRSFYPGGETPVQTGIVFENIYQNNDINELIHCVTPIDTIRLINSVIGNGRIVMYNIKVAGCHYGKEFVKLDHILFKSNIDNQPFILANDIDLYASFTNCLKQNDDINVNTNNIKIINKEIETIDKVSSYKVDFGNKHEIRIYGNIVKSDLNKLFLGIDKSNLTSVDLCNATISPEIEFSSFSKGINPNCLYYVKDTNFWSGDNIVNQGYADNILLSDNGNFKILYPFTAKKISYSRFATNKNQTIILPFTPNEITNSNIGYFSDYSNNYGYQLFSFSGFDNVDNLHFKLAQDKCFEPNTPYLVEWYDNDISIRATAFDVFLENVKPSDCIISKDGVDFKGVYSKDYQIYNYKADNIFKDDGNAVSPFYCGVRPLVGTAPYLKVIKDGSSNVGIVENQDFSHLDISVKEGILYVKSDQEREIDIYDIVGRWVRRVSLLNGVNRIQGLNTGLYLIENRKIMLY